MTSRKSKAVCKYIFTPIVCAVFVVALILVAISLLVSAPSFYHTYLSLKVWFAMSILVGFSAMAIDLLFYALTAWALLWII
jgi:hypothetical protein